jgi:hypothetical protein
MRSLLANEYRPPRICGKVPADYQGPVYYRWLRLLDGSAGKLLDQHLTIEIRQTGGQNVRQRLASYVCVNDMSLNHPDMIDASGEVKSAWRDARFAMRKRITC